jgi:hypothetical protein
VATENNYLLPSEIQRKKQAIAKCAGEPDCTKKVQDEYQKKFDKNRKDYYDKASVLLTPDALAEIRQGLESMLSGECAAPRACNADVQKSISSLDQIVRVGATRDDINSALETIEQIGMVFSAAEGAAVIGPGLKLLFKGGAKSSAGVSAVVDFPNTTSQLSPRIDISDHFAMTPKGGEVRLRYRAEVDADMHYLDATVNRDGILGFDISAQGNRELYGSGKDMFYSLMNRLEREGVEVKGIRGQWYDGQGSDNYAQFRNLLDQKMSPADAALNTWTGKRAQEFGFNSPIKINDYGTDVQVIFGRKP